MEFVSLFIVPLKKHQVQCRVDWHRIEKPNHHTFDESRGGKAWRKAPIPRFQVTIEMSQIQTVNRINIMSLIMHHVWALLDLIPNQNWAAVLHHHALIGNQKLATTR